VRIEFTDFAKEQLRDIHSYYEKVASTRVAVKIVNKILDSVEQLSYLPGIGSNEQLLSAMGLKHKFLVSGNYKIIFRREGSVVYITDIFDCRQDPKKIIERNKGV
jgi:plasmid stabilization system protein ParE